MNNTIKTHNIYERNSCDICGINTYHSGRNISIVYENNSLQEPEIKESKSLCPSCSYKLVEWAKSTNHMEIRVKASVPDRDCCIFSTEYNPSLRWCSFLRESVCRFGCMVRMKKICSLFDNKLHTDKNGSVYKCKKCVKMGIGEVNNF